MYEYTWKNIWNEISSLMFFQVYLYIYLIAGIRHSFVFNPPALLDFWLQSVEA